MRFFPTKLLSSGGMLALLLLFYMPALALASDGKPAKSETMTAGPYTLDVDFSEDPPIVGEDYVLTLHSKDNTPLTGTLLARPGLGTDAIATHSLLSPVNGDARILSGTLHLEVRGAWNISIQVHGPQGSGTVTFGVTVTAPNAMPPWIGWCIGLLPLVGCVGLIWQQWRYRNTLLKNVKQAQQAQ